jgi:hypothetical protein
MPPTTSWMLSSRPLHKYPYARATRISQYGEHVAQVGRAEYFSQKSIPGSNWPGLLFWLHETFNSVSFSSFRRRGSRRSPAGLVIHGLRMGSPGVLRPGRQASGSGTLAINLPHAGGCQMQPGGNPVGTRRRVKRGFRTRRSARTTSVGTNTQAVSLLFTPGTWRLSHHGW